jgi:hypothetical protein
MPNASQAEQHFILNCNFLSDEAAAKLCAFQWKLILYG